MSLPKNPLCPSILAPLDGVVQPIDQTELCNGVVLRNLMGEELSVLNQMLAGERTFGFGLGELLAEMVCLEASLPGPVVGTAEEEDLPDHWRYVGETEGGLVEKGITLFRLAQPGPIGARFVIAPLSQNVPSAYTLAQIAIIPAIQRKRYPETYRLSTETLQKIRAIFWKYWTKDLTKTPGLRWLNKAYSELNDDDRLAHLVFGLEQLLLKGEKERSYFSFKMALRGAWLLAPGNESRMEKFEILRKAYDLRSKVAHGSLARSLSDKELELTAELEETLRQLVIMYLESPRQFDVEELNRLTLGVATEGINTADE